jgi:hypothetical protein
VGRGTDCSELSNQKTKMLAQMKMLTAGVRQFIQDHLAAILYAESKGANPGDPRSLPKRKRVRNEEDEAAEKDLVSRMVALVEVNALPSLAPGPPPLQFGPLFSRVLSVCGGMLMWG